jgi:hypothetical protein
LYDHGSELGVDHQSTQSVGCYLQECAPGTRYDAKYGTSWQATCRYDPAVSDHQVELGQTLTVVGKQLIRERFREQYTGMKMVLQKEMVVHKLDQS